MCGSKERLYKVQMAKDFSNSINITGSEIINKCINPDYIIIFQPHFSAFLLLILVLVSLLLIFWQMPLAQAVAG